MSALLAKTAFRRIGEKMGIITPDNRNLEYCGRIDFTDACRPLFIWAGSYVRMRFTGTSVSVRLQNTHDLWSNRMGYVLDGIEGEILLFDGEKDSSGMLRDNEGVWMDEERDYLIADDLDPDQAHELLLFKRQDSCHYVSFLGFDVEDGDIRERAQESDNRLKIEVYGDSVSNGEVSEVVGYEGKADPENHNARYNNVRHSYAWKLADRLDARLQDVSQGGIALLDNTGYFHPSGLVGVLSTWDKLKYNPRPEMPEQSTWDFERFTPDIVIVAIGQNDNAQGDYMAEDYNGGKADNWRSNYYSLIKNIRGRYPAAHIIMITTVLIHDKAWDDSITAVYERLKGEGDDRVHRFLFTGNGAVTPGHIRDSEAEVMAAELEEYICEEVLNQSM